jgi:hypothetical protein
LNAHTLDSVQAETALNASLLMTCWLQQHLMTNSMLNVLKLTHCRSVNMLKSRTFPAEICVNIGLLVRLKVATSGIFFRNATF